MTRKRSYKAPGLRAELVGAPTPEPGPVPFEATDEARFMARVHLRTQQALLGKVTPRDARICLFGAALIAVEAGIEAEKVFAAFREEHERVSREFDKWKLGEPERLRAEVGLPRKEKP